MKKNTGFWIINICMVLLLCNNSKLIGAEQKILHGHIPLNALLSMSIDQLANIALHGPDKEKIKPLLKEIKEAMEKNLLYGRLESDVYKLLSKKYNFTHLSWVPTKENPKQILYSSDYHENSGYLPKDDQDWYNKVVAEATAAGNFSRAVSLKLYEFEPFKSIEDAKMSAVPENIIQRNKLVEISGVLQNKLINDFVGE